MTALMSDDSSVHGCLLLFLMALPIFDDSSDVHRLLRCSGILLVDS